MPQPEENQDEQQQEIPKERIWIEVGGQEKWVFAYTITNAAKFLGFTDKGFRNILAKSKEDGNPIPTYKPQIGRGTLILEETLKDLRRARRVED